MFVWNFTIQFKMMGIDCNMKIGSLCKRQQDFWSRWKWCGRNICNAEDSTDKWGTVKSHQWKDRKQETTVMLQRAVTDKQTILNALWENGWKSCISEPKKKKKRPPEGIPDAGKDWGQEKKGMTEDEMVGCITDSMNMNLSKLQEMVEDRGAWYAAVHHATKSWTQLSD